MNFDVRTRTNPNLLAHYLLELLEPDFRQFCTVHLNSEHTHRASPFLTSLVLLKAMFSRHCLGVAREETIQTPSPSETLKSTEAMRNTLQRCSLTSNLATSNTFECNAAAGNRSAGFCIFRVLKRSDLFSHKVPDRCSSEKAKLFPQILYLASVPGLTKHSKTNLALPTPQLEGISMPVQGESFATKQRLCSVHWHFCRVV